MSPDAVIQSYIHDVASNLPGKMRAEVAADLRTQLADELAGRAEAQGKAADEEMALGLVRDFGRPEVLAAQYSPPFSIIDPVDSRRFVLVAVIGYGMLATIVVTLRRLGLETADEFEGGFLAWLGVLIIVFGFRTWMMRKEPQKYAWKPRPVVDIDRLNWGMLILNVLGTLFLLIAYVWPGPVVSLLSGGQIPAERLAYSPYFHDPEMWRMPWLIGILIFKLGFLAWAATRGRWSRANRFWVLAMDLHIALQLGWHMTYPAPVFVDPQIERWAFGGASLLILGIGIDLFVRIYREWTWVGDVNDPAHKAVLGASRIAARFRPH